MKAKYRPPPGTLAASFRGVVQIINRKDGTHYARAWQPKAGPPQTTVNQLNTSTFSQVVKMIKNAVDLDVISAHEITRGTALLPRDVLMMAAMGTLFQFRMPDGTYIWGGPQLSQSIQALLDAISNAPGSILGRTSAGWQALIPSQAGWILTSNGESSPPVWSPNTGNNIGFQGTYTEITGDRSIGPSFENTYGKVCFHTISCSSSSTNGKINLYVNGALLAWLDQQTNNFAIQTFYCFSNPGDEVSLGINAGSWNLYQWIDRV